MRKNKSTQRSAACISHVLLRCLCSFFSCISHVLLRCFRSSRSTAEIRISDFVLHPHFCCIGKWPRRMACKHASCVAIANSLCTNMPGSQSSYSLQGRRTNTSAATVCLPAVCAAGYTVAWLPPDPAGYSLRFAAVQQLLCLGVRCLPASLLQAKCAHLPLIWIF